MTFLWNDQVSFKNFSTVFRKKASDNISLCVAARMYSSVQLFYFQISAAISYAHHSLKWKGIWYYYKNLISSLLKWYYILSFKSPDIFSNLPIVTYYWNRNWLLEKCMKWRKLASNSLIFWCLIILFIFSPRNKRNIFIWAWGQV